MSIKVNVKRSFVVNGKKYDSVDDMPPEIREAFERTMAASARGEPPSSSVSMKTAIVFNGREYTSAADMPEDARQLYEMALKAAAGGQPVERESFSVLPPAPSTSQSAPDFEKSGARRWLVVVVALAGLLLYFLLRGTWGGH